jgi:hypothetical protein
VASDEMPRTFDDDYFLRARTAILAAAWAAVVAGTLIAVEPGSLTTFEKISAFAAADATVSMRPLESKISTRFFWSSMLKF